MEQSSNQVIATLARHPSDGTYHCPLCDIPFTRRSNLKRHYAIHVRGTSLQCQDCGRSFIRRDQLRAHLPRCSVSRNLSPSEPSTSPFEPPPDSFSTGLDPASMPRMLTNSFELPEMSDLDSFLSMLGTQEPGVGSFPSSYGDSVIGHPVTSYRRDYSLGLPSAQASEYSLSLPSLSASTSTTPGTSAPSSSSSPDSLLPSPGQPLTFMQKGEIPFRPPMRRGSPLRQHESPGALGLAIPEDDVPAYSARQVKDIVGVVVAALELMYQRHNAHNTGADPGQTAALALQQQMGIHMTGSGMGA